MRIYDLQNNFEELIKDGTFQIEIIGEDRWWTVNVSTRKWSNELQRYEYESIATCGINSFLGIYDFVAGVIFGERNCSLGYDMGKVEGE